MDRRGFLGSLMAVTAAVAAGVKLPSGKELATAPAKAISVQDKLLAMLKHCNAVSISTNMSLDGPLSYEVEYIHVPGAQKHDHTKEIDRYTDKMRPVTVSVRQCAGDVTRLTVVWM